MIFKDKKTKVDNIAFRKACVVIDSCSNYHQLRNAMNYVDLFYRMYQDYKTYSHLQKLIGKKMEQISL
jgi:hypothetical protein